MDSGLADPLRHVGSREWHLACNWKVFCDNYLVRHRPSHTPRRMTACLHYNVPVTCKIILGCGRSQSSSVISGSAARTWKSHLARHVGYSQARLSASV